MFHKKTRKTKRTLNYGRSVHLYALRANQMVSTETGEKKSKLTRFNYLRVILSGQGRIS